MLRIIYSSLGIVSSSNLNHSLGKGSTALPLMNRYRAMEPSNAVVGAAP